MSIKLVVSILAFLDQIIQTISLDSSIVHHDNWGFDLYQKALYLQEYSSDHWIR